MKLRLLILCGLLALLTLPVRGADDDFTVGDFSFRIFAYENEPEEVWLIRYMGEDKNVVIPASVTSPSGKEYPVTGLRFDSFANCTSIETATITSGILYLGDNVFSGCSSLTSVSIPATVSSIGYGAFKNCGALKSVVIPDGIKEIQRQTFYGCTSLTSVVIPSSVTSIGNETFSGCESLATVALPEGITTLSANTFSNCKSLESVTLPESLRTIAASPFNGCSSLLSITIPASVNKISNGAFSGCASLKEILVASGSVSYESLNGCLYVQGNGGRQLFACPGGYEGAFEIHDGVVSILPYGFSGCEKITSLSMPKSLQVINGYAFQSCNSLMEITCGNTIPPVVADKNVFADVSENAVIYVPLQAIEQYAAAEGWNHFHDFRGTAPTELTVILDKSAVTLGVGESVTLTAQVINPGESEIVYTQWHSLDPEIATVDENGKVTGLKVGYASIGCYVGDSNNQTAVGWCLVEVVADSAIDDILVDGKSDIPVDIYTIQGICLKRNATQADIDALTPGIYIIGGKKVVRR